MLFASAGRIESKAIKERGTAGGSHHDELEFAQTLTVCWQRERRERSPTQSSIISCLLSASYRYAG